MTTSLLTPTNQADAFHSVSHHGRLVRSGEIGAFKLTETRYSPSLRIDRHLHDRPAFCFVLGGEYDEIFGSVTLACRPSGVMVRPAHLEHVDVLGRSGAHCLILEPTNEWLAGIREEIVFPRDPRFLKGAFCHFAWRLQTELRMNDAAVTVAIEGLALELAANVSRAIAGYGTRVPAWLQAAREYIAAHFGGPLELTSVAQIVGVHPVHLVRAFRQHYRITPGQFLREVRLEAAARTLVISDAPVLDIALATGFADQPHFTKAFKKFSGRTPVDFRRTTRGSPWRPVIRKAVRPTDHD